FILPVYIRDLGGTILEVGLFFFSMNAIYFSSMFFGGFLADKFDRKKLILFYWIVTTPTPLIYSFATNWIHSIPGAIIFNFALGDPAVSAYVTTAAPKKRIVRAFSITHTGYSLGMIFSPLLGAYLLTAIHIRWLFITAFLLFLASTFTISHISSQTAEKNQRRSILLDFAAVVKDKRLMSWILLFIPVTFATAMSMKFISPLLEDAYSFQKPAIL
ncbi:MAG: MFS transporter, partial [Candidatus Korarchaeota archaeon]|nr:MFS transporter [Candidatus Korarchaeota archaeon]NIU82784.1 MFS transporter [Candidatus Thorarchaeota archaeon]NIW13280.1 MFS transporter [Candidatus Thorarchaeota archaeon]NIW51719.1 MFS transporter [Candidatus Korarchaeota archaeon]